MSIGYDETRRYGSLIEKCIRENGLNMSECTIVVSPHIKKIFEQNRAYFKYQSLFDIPMTTVPYKKYVALRVNTGKPRTKYTLVDNGIIMSKVNKEEFLKLSDDEKWELFAKKV